MTNEERRALSNALDSLSRIAVDPYVCNSHRNMSQERYDYSAVGRQLLAMRMMAELVNAPQMHMLPGEFYEDETDSPELYRFVPQQVWYGNEPLDDVGKGWLVSVLLPMLNPLVGMNDSDNASLRCVRRAIAEVADIPNLHEYQLMYEHTIKPLFFHPENNHGTT